jgi:hypothetical protein
VTVSAKKALVEPHVLLVLLAILATPTVSPVTATFLVVWTPVPATELVFARQMLEKAGVTSVSLAFLTWSRTTLTDAPSASALV